MPVPPTSISAATITSQAMPMLMRMPVRMVGAAAGSITSTISTRPAGPTERVFAEAVGMRTTFEPGRIRITGNPLDVAIQTDGFFEVKTPDGVRYTRNGIFSLDGQRRLVTNLGHPVMGTKGLRFFDSRDDVFFPTEGLLASAQAAGQVRLR